MELPLRSPANTFNVLFQFGDGIPPDAQGKVMLLAETFLRESGLPACCLKETMPDDSKLRRHMTATERAKL